MELLNRINTFFQHTNSKYVDERKKILEVLEDEEQDVWKTFTSKLSATHAAPAWWYLIPLETQIEHAAREVFDSSFCDDSARECLAQFYTTVFQVCGSSTEDGRKSAESLIDSQCLSRLLNCKI